MRLQSVPALQGTLWVRRGFGAFRQRPLAFALLFACFMFGVLALALLPFIGTLLVLALLPLVSLGFMIATRDVLAGELPTPRVFLQPLRAERSRVVSLIWLGVIHALATLAAMMLGDLLDGGAFDTLMEALPAGQTAPDAMAARLNAPGLISGVLMRFALAGLLALPFWHAPALIFWEGQGCAQALFTSVLACWRNFAAFVVFGASWVGMIAATGVVGSLLFGLIGAPQLFAVAGFPLSLMFTTVFYASLYFTYRDCFAAPEPAASPEAV